MSVNSPLLQAQPAPAAPASKPEKRDDNAELEEPAHKTKSPAPITITKESINEGAEQGEGKDLMVAYQAAKSPAPRPKNLGRVEESLLAQQVRDARLAAAVAADNSGNLEVTEQLQQNTLEGPATAASTSKGSRLEFLVNDVPDPTLELLVDPLLHPNKVSCMLEFGCRFFEYTKLCSRTICDIKVIDSCMLTSCHLLTRM